MKMSQQSQHVTHQNQILSALFSPSFPIGAFSYSHGLEAAIATGKVIDRHSREMDKTCLMSGSSRNDAIIFAHAWRAEPDEWEKQRLAFALCAGVERDKEMRELGAIFATSSPEFIRCVTESVNGLSCYRRHCIAATTLRIITKPCFLPTVFRKQPNLGCGSRCPLGAVRRANDIIPIDAMD